MIFRSRLLGFLFAGGLAVTIAISLFLYFTLPKPQVLLFASLGLNCLIMMGLSVYSFSIRIEICQDRILDHSLLGNRFLLFSEIAGYRQKRNEMGGPKKVIELVPHDVSKKSIIVTAIDRFNEFESWAKEKFPKV